MVQNFYSPEDYTEELNTLQYEDVKTFRDKLLANFRFTTLFAGNILREEAQDLINVI